MIMSLSNNYSLCDISIIIPTYNPGDYLYECLESTFNQTLEKELYEVIIVLNGAYEPFYDNILNYIRQNSKKCRCSLIYTSIPNVSNARNLGMQVSRGNNICFIDDDDIISLGYLESLYKEIEEGVVVMSDVFSFVHDYTNFRRDFFVCKYLDHFSNNFSLVKNRGFLAFPVAKMIPKSIIADRKFDRRFRHGEDALFMTIISDRIKKFSFVKQDAIYYVRKREGSATSRKESSYLLLKECVLLIIVYVGSFLKHPLRYSFRLFLYRIPGVIRNTYFLLKK